MGFPVSESPNQIIKTQCAAASTCAVAITKRKRQSLNSQVVSDGAAVAQRLADTPKASTKDALFPVSANSLYFGDNLEILRNDIKSESVDLVYLDPPFNSKANYNRFSDLRMGTSLMRR